MSQDKIVTSNLIHNLQYSISYNGYSYGVQNDYQSFVAGGDYSPKELAQGLDLAVAAIMMEGNRIFRPENKHGYIQALISDSKYSLQGFENNLKMINSCAYWEPENAYMIRFTDQYVGESIFLYVPTLKHALAMAKSYAKIHNKNSDEVIVKEVGLMTDHISQNWIDTRVRKAQSVLIDSNMKRDFFELPDFDKSQPIETTGFYKWLDSEKVTDHNTIKTRDAYLKSIGYNRAFHKLTMIQIESLRHILQYHFNKTVVKA